ncbi:MAG: hypothetical protein M3209_07025 [Acidobacteriota bacterium]|nr:hypothetical protein [Acidobacteriota bacterium]
MKPVKDLNQKNTSTVWQNPLIRKVAIAGTALLVAFLLGFIPMWLRSRDNANQLAQAQIEQKRLKIESTLAGAALNARRGEYEQARQAASDFFTSLRAEADNANNSAFSSAQRESFQSVLARRDEIITLLARNDPAASDHLSEIYFSFKQALNGASSATADK